MSGINKILNQLKEFHFSHEPPLLERVFGIMSLYFPFIEACSYFGPKFYLNTTNLVMRKFYAFQILLSENRINDEKGFQIKSELTKLIWRLEDAILEIKPSDEFVKDFLTGEIFT